MLVCHCTWHGTVLWSLHFVISTCTVSNDREELFPRNSHQILFTKTQLLTHITFVWNWFAVFQYHRMVYFSITLIKPFVIITEKLSGWNWQRVYSKNIMQMSNIFYDVLISLEESGDIAFCVINAFPEHKLISILLFFIVQHLQLMKNYVRLISLIRILNFGRFSSDFGNSFALSYYSFYCYNDMMVRMITLNTGMEVEIWISVAIKLWCWWRQWRFLPRMVAWKSMRKSGVLGIWSSKQYHMSQYMWLD